MRIRSVHYGWVVVAVTFTVLLVSAAIRATPGVLIVPLEQEFGWSAETISGAIAINILLYGLIGPFAGAVIERFGLRRTVSAALLLLACGVAATSVMASAVAVAAALGAGCRDRYRDDRDGNGRDRRGTLVRPPPWAQAFLHVADRGR